MLEGSWTDIPATRAILRRVGANEPALASLTYRFGATRDAATHYSWCNPDVKLLHRVRKVWCEQFDDAERLHHEQITVDDAIACAVSVAGGFEHRRAA